MNRNIKGVKGGFQTLFMVVEKQTVVCDEVVQQKNTYFLIVRNKQIIVRCVLV